MNKIILACLGKIKLVIKIEKKNTMKLQMINLIRCLRLANMQRSVDSLIY